VARRTDSYSILLLIRQVDDSFCRLLANSLQHGYLK
jgi:hypothetical protein